MHISLLTQFDKNIKICVHIGSACESTAPNTEEIKPPAHSRLKIGVHTILASGAIKDS